MFAYNSKSDDKAQPSHSKFSGGSINELIYALFGSKCSGSNIIDDFVTSYESLTQRYNDDISNWIDSALKQFQDMMNEFKEKTPCMGNPITKFPFLPPLPPESEFLLAARLASQFDCGEDCPMDVIHTSKIASFREIKKILKNLWLEDPTPAPGSDCEKGIRKLNKPTFVEMSLLVQKQAIEDIENDCFPILAEKYDEWYGRYPAQNDSDPAFPLNDCTYFLYGVKGTTDDAYCKGS